MLALDEEPPVALPRVVGNYQVLEPIGQGGMGVVYKARDMKLGRLVALKMLIGGEWAEERARRRFWREAELAAHVERPNIVPIREVGEFDGQAYYVMPLMAASLAERASAFAEPTKAAELVVQLARAIDFGHKRNVVHLDLKPGNILLDENNQPFIADFGISRRLGGKSATTAPGFRATPGYMAPEQVNGDGELTHAVDVWGLGAVLYDLVCGRTPFEPKVDLESLRRLRDEEPTRPRLLVSGLDRDFEAIILKCLEKAPQRRYETASALADDLERWLGFRPVQARLLGKWGRLGRWCRRRPSRAAAIVSASCFAGVFLGNYVHEFGVLQQVLAEEVLRTNAWIATAQAGVVETRLRALSDLVEDVAKSGAFTQLLDPDQQSAPLLSAVDWPSPTFDRFDSFMVLDANGTLKDRVPSAPEYVGARFEHRSHFACAVDLARRSNGGTCVSGAYRSDIDEAFRFAVSAPIRSAEDSLLGVAVGTLKADSLLLSLVIPETAEHRAAARNADHGASEVSKGDQRVDSSRRRTIALAARRDQASGEQDGTTGDWLLLQHRELQPGSSMAVRSAALVALTPESPSQTDDAYVDPVVGGRWLAGFARVPGTAWAVIVQTPEDNVWEPHRNLVHWLLRASAIAAAAGLGVGVASYWLARGRAHHRAGSIGGATWFPFGRRRAQRDRATSRP